MATNNIRLGNLTPSKFYLGQNEVSKIYLGNNTIYEVGGGGGLPSEYQQVEWIGANGNGQYIDTNISSINDYDFEFKFSIDVVKASSPFCACWSSNDGAGGSGIGLNSSGYVYFYYGKNSFTFVTKLYVGNIYIGSKNGKTIKIDNASRTFTTDYFSTDKRRYTIFCMNNLGTPGNYFCGKLYYAKLTLGQEIVANFIPCYRKSDGEIGIYDLVSGTFFTNAGTGTFTKGEDI